MFKVVIVIYFILLPFLGYQAYADNLFCDMVCSKPSQLYVTKVYDGDTLELNDGSKIRMIGYNTVERGELGYYKQGKKLSDLVVGKPVKVAIAGLDKYERKLGVLFAGNTCINKEMREWLKRQGVGEYNKYDYMLTSKQKQLLGKCGINL